MLYFCRDCSYRGNSSGQGGNCPACGSFNIEHARKEEEKEPERKLHVIILVALWTYLIALILWKLIF
jgi:predicted ATP-dependent serine protease